MNTTTTENTNTMTIMNSLDRKWWRYKAPLAQTPTPTWRWMNNLDGKWWRYNEHNYDRHHQHHDNNEQPGQKVMERQQYRHDNEQSGQKVMDSQQYRHDNEQPSQKVMESQCTVTCVRSPTRPRKRWAIWTRSDGDTMNNYDKHHQNDNRPRQTPTSWQWTLTNTNTTLTPMDYLGRNMVEWQYTFSDRHHHHDIRTIWDRKQWGSEN